MGVGGVLSPRGGWGSGALWRVRRVAPCPRARVVAQCRSRLVRPQAFEKGTLRLTVAHADGTSTEVDTGIRAGADEGEAADVKLCNDAGGAADVADLVVLTHLHEPAILEVLGARFAAGLIYTWTGPVLIAVNPFQTLPLYDDSTLEACVPPLPRAQPPRRSGPPCTHTHSRALCTRARVGCI